MMSWKSNMSLYIPLMKTYYPEERIANLFHALCLGKVHHVDFVNKKDSHGHYYYSVHIHFEEWYNTKASLYFRENAKRPNGTKLVYDDPCYWMVFENKTQKVDVSLRRTRYAMFDFSYTLESSSQDSFSVASDSCDSISSNSALSANDNILCELKSSNKPSGDGCIDGCGKGCCDGCGYTYNNLIDTMDNVTSPDMYYYAEFADIYYNNKYNGWY